MPLARLQHPVTQSLSSPGAAERMFCRGGSHLQSTDVMQRRVPSMMWVGLVPSVEGLKSKN